MRKILYVCTHNSSRSQMAEAFTNRLGMGIAIAESAGTHPGTGVNPVVVDAMREIGYDMVGRSPKLMTEEMVDSADRIITMGCGVNLTEPEVGVCPAVLVPSEDWGLDDPHGRPIEKVRQIRDEIRERVEALVAEMSG